MAGLDNKLKPTSVILTDRGYMSVAEAEYQHSLGNLNIIGRDGRAVNSQDLVQQEGDTTLQGFEPTAQEIIESNLEPLIGLPALEAGDIYKQMGGFGSTLDNRTGIQSSQQMFDETYQEALANEALANVLETQGVPDVVPFSVQGALSPVNVADGINQFETNYVKGLLDQGLVTVDQVAAQTGIPAAEIQQQYNTLTGLDPETEESINQELADFLASQETDDFSTTGLENDLEGDGLDPNILGGGDESIVTDDPQAEWDKVDKDADFGTLLDEALRIFGVYNRDAISNVVKVVNDRGMSVGEVAAATGNTVESINQAAAESGTAIENQGLVDPQPTGRVIGDPFEVNNNGGGGNNGGGDDDDGNDDDSVIVSDPPPFMPELPKQQTTNITLIQNIMNETPITESILFPTKFTKLENVQQGMFEQFLSAAGGNQ
jgi:hypothetical protein